MTIHERLLAKKVERGEAVPHLATLRGHLQSVHSAAEAITDVAGVAMLETFGIDADQLPRFRKIVTLAAAVHDIGKANDHFLGMLTRAADRADNDYRQAVRHEWLTWWWLHQPHVREWAEQSLEHPDDWYLVLCCVAGHHPKFGRSTPPDHAEGGSKIKLLFGHSDFGQVLDWLSEVTAAETKLPRGPDVILRCAQGLNDDAVAEIHRQFVAVRTHIDNLGWGERDDWQHLCAAAKACLVAADVAGSALSDRQSSVVAHTRWIVDQLQVQPAVDDIEQLVKERLGDHDERPFQTEVAAAGARVTLVTAGCGSGKTVAAWLWAARQCPQQRVFFCYPTTGTATEGFRGYLFAEQTKLGAKLFHSRAPIDFDVILNAEPDEDDASLQISSLEAWGTPLVCCTVDTVLGIMQNQRRGLHAWPALAQSAFVFDEIHAYDDKLFGSLLRFLNDLLGLRVLLMTASLPAPRLKAIEEVLNDQDDQLHVIRGPAKLEQLPRYHRFDPADVHQAIVDEIHVGGRVLYICNVVDRAMAVADEFAEFHPLIYHSRFRYEDRVEQHKAVVGAFDRDSTKGCLAVCTQVAEMSLDISATLLVTEICPVPALIQRLGRLNRHAQPASEGEKEPPTMPFSVIEPLQDDGSIAVMPYSDEEEDYGDWPTQTREWLDALGTKDIHQKTLADAWSNIATADVDAELITSTWIEGGPATVVDSLRESSFSVTVVRPGDDAARVTGHKSELTRVAIPMPPPPFKGWQDWRHRNGYLVPPADKITYNNQRGAQWNRLTASE